MKQQNWVFIDNSVCKMKELFVPFSFALSVHFVVCYLFLTFSQWKMRLSSQNKVFSEDSNYIEEMQISWENFVIVKDEKFRAEIRVFLITCLFDLFLTCLLDLIKISFILW